MVRFIRSSLVVALTLGVASPAFAEKADDLSVIPVGAELVMGLDFQQLQASALWKQFIDPLLAKGEVKKGFDEFKQTCGVDPMKVVTKVVMGVSGLGDKKPDGVIVAHGVPKAKLVACYVKMQKKKPMGGEVTVDGDVLIVKQPDQTVAFTFLDDTTALIVMGKDATKDGVKNVAKGTSALKSSAKFVEFYKKTNTNDTLWMIMNGNSKAFDPLRGMNIKPLAVYGSLNVTKDLNLDMKMRFGTPDEAKSLSAMAQGQLAAAQGMVDKINITTDGPDLKVAVLLTDKKLLALKKQFEPMMKK